MSNHRRYRVPNDDVFAALMRERSIGGFSIEPMPPIEIRDCYLDGETTPLLRAGLTLRLRIREGACTGVLQPLGNRSAPTISQQIDVPDSGEKMVIPDGPLRHAIEVFAGGVPLAPILDLRQYRTPRSLNFNNAPIGVMSLDVVSDETAERIGVWNTVEVELVKSAPENAMNSIHTELEARGIMEDVLTKFQRGVMRRGVNPEAPLVLLPEERELLEELLTSPLSVERRRAETILLSAENLTVHEISRRVGLAPSRVRHWQYAFRTERIRVFDGEESELETSVEGEPFRITPLVTDPTEYVGVTDTEEIHQAQEEFQDDFWVPIEDTILPEYPAPEQSQKESIEEKKRSVPTVPGMEFSPYSSLKLIARKVILQAAASCRGAGKEATPEAVQAAFQTARLVPLVLEWLGERWEDSGIAYALGYLEALRDQDIASALLGKESENQRETPLAVALAKIVLGVRRRKAITSEILNDLEVELSVMSENLPETEQQLRHVLGSSLWASVEHISMYSTNHDLDVLNDSVNLLEDHLRFLPSVPDELASVVFAGVSIEECRALELLTRHLTDIADEWIEPDGTVDRTPLDQLLERLIARKGILNERVATRWETLQELPFRSAVAQSIAAL